MRLLVFLALSLRFAVADDVDDYIRAQMTARRIPGLALAVVRDGKLVKQQAYGLANVELQVPVRTETVFLLASLTKTFTGAAVLALVEDGKVKLDDSISKYVPGLPKSWEPVTVRHCLAHTSGLPDLVGPDYKLLFFTLDDALRQLAGKSVQPPAARAVYNQTGYALLGMLIREVSGQGFEGFIAGRFLKPLEMSHTTYGDQVDLVTGRASMYTVFEPSEDRMWVLIHNGGPVISKDGIRPAVGYVYPRFTFTGVGLNSSIADLVKWELALAEGRVLRPATLAEAAHPFRLGDGKDGQFGLSWMSGLRNGHPTMQFGGGAAVWHLRLPDDHLSVIVLTNLQGSGADDLSMGVAQIYVPELNTATGKQ
jgi:D-alanyl-D-alanine carboxypeptidase